MNLLTVHPDTAHELAGLCADIGLPVEKVLDYLSSGHVVLSSHRTVTDPVDPTLPDIPLSFFTDGTYVWSMELVACVDRHAVSLPAEALDHIKRSGGRFVAVPDSAMTLALQAVLAAIR